MRPELRYRSLEQPLRAGDRVLFITDGMAEARDADDEPVGYEGLAWLLGELSRNGGGDGLGAWLDALFDRVRAQSGRLPEDDWTALVVERG